MHSGCTVKENWSLLCRICVLALNVEPVFLINETIKVLFPWWGSAFYFETLTWLQNAECHFSGLYRQHHLHFTCTGTHKHTVAHVSVWPKAIRLITFWQLSTKNNLRLHPTLFLFSLLSSNAFVLISSDGLLISSQPTLYKNPAYHHFFHLIQSCSVLPFNNLR